MSFRQVLLTLATRCRNYHQKTTEKEDIIYPPDEKGGPSHHKQRPGFSINLGPLSAAVSGGPIVVTIVSISLLILLFGPNWL